MLGIGFVFGFYFSFALVAATEDGATPLHRAAFDNDAKQVALLLKSGADPNASTRIGKLTPLTMAAANGNPAILETLLKAGADANVRTENGATALMLAVTPDAVRVLVAHGADVNAKDTARGQTALMFAAAKNRPTVIEALIQAGADPKVSTDVKKLERPRFDEDGNPLPAAGAAPVPGKRPPGVGGFARGTSATVMGGITALLLAARDGNLEATKALLDNGADVNQVSGGEKTSPLVIAICNGHYTLARHLLDRGANPNLATIDGLAALYAVEDAEFAQMGWAPNPITTQEKVGYLDLMKALLDKGADSNAKLTKALWFRPTSHNQEWIDKKGATPFWRAAQANDVPAMKLLKERGGDANIATAEGVTPLMVAAGLGWGANASRTVPDGWISAVKYLVEELQADVNAHDMYNYTALHGAAYRGDNELVKYLVQKGAKLDVRSKKGQTVTDMANGQLVNAHLPMEHPDTVALLLKLGAPPAKLPVAGAPRAAKVAEKENP
jgi:ankyrin repeat protein